MWIIMFLFLGSSIFSGRPFYHSIVTFSLFLLFSFFLLILCRRLLTDDTLNFHQIFRRDASSSEVCTAATFFEIYFWTVVIVVKWFIKEILKETFSKTSKDILLKFSEITDLPFFWCTSSRKCLTSPTVVTRRKVKKLNFSTILFFNIFLRNV